MKILWAFEPFHQTQKQCADFYNTLKQIKYDKKTAKVSTGFIVSHTENELLLAADIPYRDRFTKLPKKYTKDALKKAKISIHDKDIHIVDFPTFSTTKTVQEFSKLAKKHKTDLVGLFSHSNKGFKRFFIGSFAETAIHHINCDILIANPDTKYSQKIKNILYSCDFSEESKKHVQKILEICKNNGAHLSIYHAAEPYYKATDKDLTDVTNSYRTEISKYEKFLDEACEKSNVTCSLYITSNFDRVSKNLIKLATKIEADLIVTSSKMGPLMSIMGGSITRQIIRLSKKPVLVLK